MAGDIVLDYVSNDAQVIASFRAQQKELQKERSERQALEKVMQAAATRERSFNRERFAAAKKQGQQQEQLAAIARKAIDSIRTPTQAYEADLHELTQALNAGKLKTNEYTAAKFKLLAKLRDSKREQSGENAAIREAAQVVAATRTATERYELALGKLNRLRAAGKISADTHARATAAEKANLDSASTGTAGFGKSLMTTAGQLTGFAGGVAGVLKIVQQLRAEYQRLIERQNEAGNSQVTLAGAQSQAVKNLGSDKSLDARGLFARMKAESGRLGMSEVELTRAVSDALSARGDKSAAAAVQATLAAAKFERFGGAETLQTLSGSALDISKVTGKSFESSLGFMSQIGQLSRVTNTDELSKNVVPAVVNASTSGASAEFAGALVSSLTQGIVDSTGRVSRTTLASMMQQLEDFDPSRNIEETYNQLVDSPALRKQFLADATFEKKARSAVENVLTQGTAERKAMTNALNVLASNDSQSQFDSVVTQQNSLPAVQAAIAQQRLKTLAENIQTGDESGGISGIVRTGLADVRKALGRSGFGAGLDAIFEDFSSGGMQDLEGAISALNNEAARIQFETVTQRTATGGVRTDSIRREDLTTEEQSQLRALKAAVTGLGELNEQINERRAAEAAAGPVDVGPLPAFVPAAAPRALNAVPRNSGPKLTEAELLGNDEAKPAKDPFSESALAGKFLSERLARFKDLPGIDTLTKGNAKKQFASEVESGAVPLEAAERALLSAVQPVGNESLSAADQRILTQTLKEIRDQLKGQNTATAEQTAVIKTLIPPAPVPDNKQAVARFKNRRGE